MSRHNRDRRRLRREEKARHGPTLPEPKSVHPPVYYDPNASVRGNPSDKGTSQPVFVYPRFKSDTIWFTPPVACR